MIHKYIGFALALAATVSCHNDSKKTTVAEKIDWNKSEQEKVQYIADFASAQDAKSHVDDVKAAGGKAKVLRSSDTRVAVSVNANAVESLTVQSTVELIEDAKITVGQKKKQEESKVDYVELADSVMTAKNVVGVDKLRSRKENADGAGVVVAVFDTGIDFGLPGVSSDSKLKGFYDLTDFGRVKISKKNRLSSKSRKIKTSLGEIKFAKSIKFEKLTAKGVLSEQGLAAEYLAPTVDLDGNGKFDDEFSYIVGKNSDGQNAVWIDIDRDGLIKDRQTEELTDFNNTGSYVILRPEAGPSGAKPLAISFHADDDIQFHSVPGGHGTSCAIVIGGDRYANGYLTGMAPKTEFISYMLDVTGQDVYTMSQFMDMFTHARDQKVDAISISWGFTVSNLKSARYFSKFLDDEIASQGIVIGIANGNEGPAYSSGYTTDYIPHNGFAVGAMVSEQQARNVYGWNGDVEDSVIWYSSFGPTRGGRQVPDVISPLMTMVRGSRNADGTIYRGFGGTSSATPALIGAVSAMMSQAKSEGLNIDARLLKMAVVNTAKPIKHVDENRQGSGVIDVDAAYDLYVKLVKETNAAKKDESKRTEFPYDLRAATKITGMTEAGEGLILEEFEASKTIAINLTPESSKLIDPLDFAAPLAITHQESFLQTNDSVLLQATGARISVQFNASELSAPGTYTDSIEFRRPSDGLVLLKVPVIVRVPHRVSKNLYQVDSVNQTLTMNDQWRSVIDLSGPQTLEFEGAAVDQGEGFGTYLGFFVQNSKGDVLFQEYKSLKQSVTPISFSTGSLPAGRYELVVFRGGSRPAVVTPIHLAGAWHKPRLNVLATHRSEQGLSLLVDSKDGLSGVKALVEITHATQSVELKRDLDMKRPGFVGKLDGKLSGTVGIAVSQNDLDRASEEFLNVSLAINSDDDSDNLYRGWINFFDKGAPMQEVDLEGEAEKVNVIAYPNIVNWDEVLTQSLSVDIRSKLEEPIVSEELELTKDFFKGSRARFDIKFAKDLKLPKQGQAVLKLFDEDGKLLQSIDLEM